MYISLMIVGASLFVVPVKMELDEKYYDTVGFAERRELAECYASVLDVAKKYEVGRHLSELTDAACQRQFRAYGQKALAERPPDDFVKWDMEVRGHFLAGPVILGMFEKAQKLYGERVRSQGCVGDACKLVEYRRCLLVQFSLQSCQQSNTARI